MDNITSTSPRRTQVLRHAFMLVVLLFGACVRTDASGVATAADESVVELRVLCYNIHYGQGMDGEYDIERLAAVIRVAKPDLVALQEVDVGVRRSGRMHQAQRLGELTGLSAWYGPTQHYEGGLYGNAILSRLPVESVLIQPLPYSDSTPARTTYPRGAVAVMVQLPDKSRLRFISTHFQHSVHEDRVAEAAAINQHFAVDDGIPSILAGDMNARPDEEPVQILLQQWQHALDDDASPTAPSVNPRSRIDYVFYRGHGRLSVRSSHVIPEEMASDHRPVLVEFVLQNDPRPEKKRR